MKVDSKSDAKVFSQQGRMIGMLVNYSNEDK